MPKTYFKFSLLFYCLIIVLVNSACHSNDEVNNESQYLSVATVNLDGIETGDILLKRGNGRISNMITDFFKEKVPLSHCGIIVCSVDSTYIVHSVAGNYARKDGVQTVLLKDMLKDCRPNFFYIVRKKAAKEARENFAKKALAYTTQNIPFDDQADNQDKSKMSCTELIYWSQIESFGQSDITSINITGKEVFVFNGFLDTAKYQIIKHY
jgi:hypothetical protein